MIAAYFATTTCSFIELWYLSMTKVTQEAHAQFLYAETGFLLQELLFFKYSLKTNCSKNPLQV